MRVTSCKTNPETAAGFLGWLGHGTKRHRDTDAGRQVATAAGDATMMGADFVMTSAVDCILRTIPKKPSR